MSSMEDKWRLSVSPLATSSKMSTSSSILTSGSLARGGVQLQPPLLWSGTSVGTKRQLSSGPAEASTASSKVQRQEAGNTKLTSAIDTHANPFSKNFMSVSASKPTSIKISSLSTSSLSSNTAASVSSTVSTASNISTHKAFSHLNSSVSTQPFGTDIDEENSCMRPSFPKYPNLAGEDKSSVATYKQSMFESADTRRKSDADNINAKKEKLVQFVSVVSGGLSGELKKKDSTTRNMLDIMVEEVIQEDPEFILKLSLYCRKELNLRLISNLLLALAAKQPSTSFYLKKYFSCVVVTPADWIMVANLFLTVGSDLAKGSLPAALRRVMKEKFPSFDEYQLAKYNRSMKGPDMEHLQEEEERQEVLRGRDYDLKRLVRLLHLSDPAHLVMAVVGRRYPATKEVFRQSRLDGVFDPLLAGRRMKLRTPVTWETQISAQGNTASAWERLIEERRLPYLATVRNLRNLLLAGVSTHHIQKVCQHIASTAAVAKGRLFPFQYFTAYDILTEITDIKEGKQDKQRQNRKVADNKEKKEKWMIQKEKKNQEMIRNINLKHVEAVKKALDTAVNISARRNIPPLKGTTLILCGYSLAMGDRFTAAKGVTQRGASVRDAAALFSLMCHMASEDGHLVLFSGKHRAVELPSAELLSNVAFIRTDADINKKIGQQSGGGGAAAAVRELVSSERWLDNIVMFHDGGGLDEVYSAVSEYRRFVNRGALFASVNILGQPSRALEPDPVMTHASDLNIFGFSDSVFNLIISAGNGGQLREVETIDQKHRLTQLPSPLSDTRFPGPSAGPERGVPVWQQVRVFISSTFLDMEAERNILHQFVLPQLQRRAAARFVSLEFVDLRWGLSQEQVAARGAVELCLEQVTSCSLFLGILGERYGWVPGPQLLAALPAQYGDLGSRAAGRGYSMTQLEMECGVLGDAAAARDKAFFFFRDSGFLADWPEREVARFAAEDDESRAKVRELKARIREAGLEVMTYPATLGSASGPVLGLEEFGSRALENLWNAVDKMVTVKVETEQSKQEEELRRQLAHCRNTAHQFVGRGRVVEEVAREVAAARARVLQVSGPAGAGVSAVLGKVAADCARLRSALVIPFSRGVSELASLGEVLTYLIARLGGQAAEDTNMQNLSVNFHQALEKFCLTERRVLIVLDDVEQMDSFDTCCLPDQIPDNCVIMIKTKLGGKLNSWLKKRDDATEIIVKPLEVKERIEITKEVLNRKGKSLDENVFNNQLVDLVSKRGGASPSYLMLAIDRISAEGNFDNLSSQIKSLGSTTIEMLGDVLKETEETFGNNLVASLVVFLSQSLHGLTKNQLFKLVSFFNYLHGTNFRQSTNVGKLVQEMETFKTLSYGSVSFMDMCMCLERINFCLEFRKQHIKLSEFARSAIQERYIKPRKSSYTMEVHAVLAALYVDLYSNDILQKETLLSLAHHIGASGDVKLLKNVICSPKYLQTKSTLGQGHLLLSDFMGKSLKFKSAQEKFIKDPLVTEYQEFIQNNFDIIKNQPNLIPQLLLNEPNDSVLRRSAAAVTADPQLTLFRWENKPSSTEERHSLGQTLARNPHNPTTFLLHLEARIVSGFSNGSVLVSDADTLEDLYCLVGHAAEITGIQLLSRSVLVTASRDGLLCSWDLDTRIRLASVQAHDRALVSLSARQPSLVTAGWDGAIKVWDKSLGLVTALRPGTGPLNTVLVHPRKELCITGGWDNTIRIWDLQTYKSRAVIRGHTSSVQALALTEDCRKIVSGSLDGEVKVWDSSTGAEVASFATGHGLARLALDPGGALVHVAHTSGTVASWPLALGRSLARLQERDLRCPLAERLEAGARQLEATQLPRTVTALHQLGPQLLLGFDTGDVELLQLGAGARVGGLQGWKVFQSRIEVLGGCRDLDFIGAKETYVDWNDIMEEETLEMEEDSSDSDPSSADDGWNWFEPDTATVFSEAPTSSCSRGGQGGVLTMWIAAGNRVSLGVLRDGHLIKSLTLNNIGSNVVDIKTIKTLVTNVTLLLVFTESGLVHIFGKGDGSPAHTVDTGHGSLAGVSLEEDVMVTVGGDKKVRVWDLAPEAGDKIKLRTESEFSLVSRPVGVARFSARQRSYLLVACADGSLARVEARAGSLCAPQLLEGNGRGVVAGRLQQCGGRVLLQQEGGLVSLWTEAGAEIAQHTSLGCQAALLTNEENQVRLVLGGGGLDILAPTEAECARVHGGHQGEVTALLAPAHRPGQLLSAARDGQLRRWPAAAAASPPQLRASDQVVGVSLAAGLSLSRAGLLTSYDGVEAAAQTRLEGDRFRLLAAAVVEGVSWLVTVRGAGRLQAWRLARARRSLGAELVADRELGCRVHSVQCGAPAPGTQHSRHLGELLSIWVAGESAVWELSLQQVRQHAAQHRLTYGQTLGLRVAELPDCFAELPDEFYKYAEVVAGGLARLHQSLFLLTLGGRRMLLRTLEDGSVRVTREGEDRGRCYQLHHRRVTDMARAGGGLVTAGEDGRLKLWRLGEAGLEQAGEWQGPGPGLACLDTAEDGRLVAGDSAGSVFFLSLVQAQ